MSNEPTYYGLKALVQYRRKETGIRWVNMAAFDSMHMAEKYAIECSNSDRPWEYRAVEVPDEIAYSNEAQP